MTKKGADIFLATVDAKDGDTWKIKPLIVEVDGTDHPGLVAVANKGVTPSPGDKVLVVTMRNNIDGAKISRYFEATEANAVIVWVFQSESKLTLTGDFILDGNLTIEGGLTVSGEVNCGSLIIGGVPFENHMHLAGALISAAPGYPVTGMTGGVSPTP